MHKYITENSLLNRTEVQDLKQAISRRQKVVTRKALGPVDIWLWSSDIEGVMLKDSATEVLIETFLVSLGELSHLSANDRQRKQCLRAKIKACAHKPELLEIIVRELWALRPRTKELSAAAKEFCSVN